MRTIVLIATMLFAAHLSQAAPSKYEEVMKENIEKLYESRTIEEYQTVINKFDRIAAKETDKWGPLYYAGFGYIMMATNADEVSMKDKYLDLALERINAGKAIAPKESEIIALEGFVHMIRVTVDPATRGAQYSGLSMQAFSKALEINPDNPRALYLMGQMEFGTAKFFGADTSEACTKIQAAVSKFDVYTPDSPLAPAWGKGGAIAASEMCK
ncbi:hypothetical protein JMN32_24655 [Fulvivirga sp. 29W222]|uniref:Tetratricopeptide repeat protein n=1 Tax=Fulvivirga marina TaxID=2494733 RepID=A0A937G3D3_9BACT|nr:hypothetical protein [Fulvivirga marina]MBL6449526.1 hypothetical protein [Fulvivirga marina]